MFNKLNWEHFGNMAISTIGNYTYIAQTKEPTVLMLGEKCIWHDKEALGHYTPLSVAKASCQGHYNENKEAINQEAYGREVEND